jgi:hypothetical protein
LGKIHVSNRYHNDFLKIVSHRVGSGIWANTCSDYRNRFYGLNNDEYTKFSPHQNFGLLSNSWRGSKYLGLAEGM